MITVAPISDKTQLKNLFDKCGIVPDEYSGAVVAKSGEEMLGYCLYKLYEKGITVVDISPKDDIPLADGILRSALHVATTRCAMDARYEGKENEELFHKLGFILDKKDKKLDVDKLFKSCGCNR